ncbi:MAG: HEAT repeat domain-containing protein [Planctomycetes bacterium]|nr:HEAT repeat domain-containing protein [Planctomycetota bacterium]
MTATFSNIRAGCGFGRGVVRVSSAASVMLLAAAFAFAQSGGGAPGSDKPADDAAKGAADKRAAEAVDVPADATVESLFVDFLHYARLGRFTAADAYAKALLEHPNLDPIVVMETANRDKKSVDTLLIIIKSSSIGERAAKVLELIHEGENLKRQDREQIRANIAKLGGNPQQEYFATRYLAESGEHAVPALIQTLLDPAHEDVWPRVVIALDKLGKAAVNPLVMALSMANNDVRLNVIHALGEIGYLQAVPYLSRLRHDPKMPEATQRAASAAMDRIFAISGRSLSAPTPDLLFGLAEAYYNEDDAVKADPRLQAANVWYWDEANQGLKAVPVAPRIFGTIMAMRCCEEALRLQNDHAGAISLWLAANFRRESRLGLNTESGDPAAAGEPDPTRPRGFPRALYFAQAAGPRYAHLVLERAVHDGDTSVALGAIEALRVTAGESSLIGTEDYKQPLVQALRFPDLLVRLRAALALGQALPKSPFADSQYVVPLLAAAVNLTGDEHFVVLDDDEANLNRVASALRGDGRHVMGDTSFFRVMERVRAEAPTITAFVIATDLKEPPLGTVMAQLRGEFAFSRTPVVVLSKTAGGGAGGDVLAEAVEARADEAAIIAALDRVRQRSGQAKLDGAKAMSLAMEAVETLRRIAADGRTVYNLSPAQPALIAALGAADEKLRVAAAGVLAYSPAPEAQQAIADLALDAANALALRLAGYAALADSARNYGNLLTEAQVAELVRVARDEPDLVLRTAASQALGAVNLASNQASDIIRRYYGG